MDKEESLVASKEKPEDKTLDLTLRPRSLKEFIGQELIKKNLSVFMAAAKQRKEPIEHTLVFGPPGIGKTTLAHIIANEMKVNIRVTSGPAIERAGDLGAILTNLEDGDILFIDEVHRLPKVVEEVLYPSMEEYLLDIIVGKGPTARTLRLELPHFTIIGATTRASLLSAPLRDRFGITYRLDFYSPEDIGKIIIRSAKILGIEIAKEAVMEIAQRARRTPRVANRLLKRVRDFAQVKLLKKIDLNIAEEAMERLEIDNLGLDMIDRRILETVIDKFNGGPVGLGTIAAATSEEKETIEEIYEPFLLQIGFIARTPRGRVVTEQAYKHLGLNPPANLQNKLI